ncbi:MAG: 30S ribosomal protein S12 methylthiotransferase RimO [Planctomycetota bacterium]
MTTGADTVTSGAEGQSDTIETVSFVSLGCPKNLVDSEKMLGLLAEDGLMPVSAGAGGTSGESGAGRADISEAGSEQDGTATGIGIDDADAVVINTCGFLEASKQESLGVIREAVAAKEAGRVKRVVVAGCLVQRHRAKMLEWAPGIDAMIGVFDRDHVVEAVRGAKRERATLAEASDGPSYWIAGNALQAAKERGINTVGLTVNGKDGKGTGYFESDASRLRLTPRHYAYLRISEGCNQACAFCTIPSIRGKMRSKGVHSIVDEARELIRDGAHELLLIGQDTTSYGDDVGLGLHQVPSQAGVEGDHFRAGLPMLLSKLDDAMRAEMGNNGWLRLMYAYPTTFSDETIDAFAELVQKGRVLPYIDIPLQHASDGMLEAMRRHVTAQSQLELMHKLRERIPGMAIRTTFISGFPGETEQDHEQLLEFIEEVGFDAVGVFAYSKEQGTPAGRMESDPDLAVPEEIKQRRREEVLETQQRIAFEQAEYLAEQFDESEPDTTGVRFDVLIDRATDSVLEDTAGVSAKGRLYQGRTYFQAPQIDAATYVHSSQELSPGELVRCVVVGSDGYDLIAKPVEEVERRVSLPLA